MRFEPTSPNLRIRLLAFCRTREEAGMRLAGVLTPLHVPKMPLAEPPPRGPGGRTAGLQRPYINPVTQARELQPDAPWSPRCVGPACFGRVGFDGLVRLPPRRASP